MVIQHLEELNKKLLILDIAIEKDASDVHLIYVIINQCLEL